MELGSFRVGIQQVVLPDHCTDLIFDIGNTPFKNFGSTRSKIIGVMTHAKGSVLVPGNKLLGIRFKPYGASAVFGIQADELMDQSIDISLIRKNEFNIRDQLIEFDETLKQVELLNEFFLSKIKIFHPIHKPTERAVHLISKSGGSISVSTLAETLGLTRRHLSRSFATNVGLSPKEFLRIERFRAVLKVIDSAKTQPDWSNLALEYGFYDQAHFVGEFSRIMGTSPHRYWKKSA